MKTKNEIFELVAGHLLTQNEVSINPATDDCEYRGPNGLKCAVGCLIQDEFYNPVFEGEPVVAAGFKIRNKNQFELLLALNKSGVDVTDKQILRMLGELQVMHDCEKVSEWPEHLNRIARDYDVPWGDNVEKTNNKIHLDTANVVFSLDFEVGDTFDESLDYDFFKIEISQDFNLEEVLESFDAAEMERIVGNDYPELMEIMVTMATN